MKPSRFILCAVATAAASSLYAGDAEIIVESFGDGLNSSAFQIQEGGWLDSDAKSKAPGLKAKKSKFNTADTNAGTARFVPEIPVAGRYQVYITYGRSANAKGVPHRVSSAEGMKEFNLDQNGAEPASEFPPNKWVLLGTFQFNKGTDGYVEVADPMTGERAYAGEPNARVYADAIKLVPEGFTLPADYVNKPGEGGGSAVAAAAPSAAPAPPPALEVPKTVDVTSLPRLTGSSSTASAPVSNAASLPALPSAPAAASSAPPGMPSLSALDSVTDAAAKPADSAGSMPSLAAVTGSGAPAGSSLPSLGSVAGSSSSGLPSLTSAASPSPSSSGTGLPSLTDVAGSGSSSAPSAGLPSLPGSNGSGSGLPSLPAAASASSSLPSLPSISSGEASSPAGLPSLPSVAASAPAPAGLPSLPSLPSGDTPSPSPAGAGLPALTSAPGSTAPAPSAGLPAAPAAVPSGLPDPAAMASLGGVPSIPAAPSASMPPADVSAASPAAPVPSAPSVGNPLGAAGLQWIYDLGAAMNQARAQSRKILVFFTAPGNRAAEQYEASYFTDPAVRSMMDKYVLVKVDFPRSTQLGYRLGIYGAGMIAITDPNGTKLGAVLSIPASPQDFVRQIESIQ